MKNKLLNSFLLISIVLNLNFSIISMQKLKSKSSELFSHLKIKQKKSLPIDLIEEAEWISNKDSDAQNLSKQKQKKIKYWSDRAYSKAKELYNKAKDIIDSEESQEEKSLIKALQYIELALDFYIKAYNFISTDITKKDFLDLKKLYIVGLKKYEKIQLPLFRNYNNNITLAKEKLDRAKQLLEEAQEISKISSNLYTELTRQSASDLNNVIKEKIKILQEQLKEKEEELRLRLNNQFASSWGEGTAIVKLKIKISELEKEINTLLNIIKTRSLRGRNSIRKKIETVYQIKIEQNNQKELAIYIKAKKLFAKAAILYLKEYDIKAGSMLYKKIKEALCYISKIEKIISEKKLSPLIILKEQSLAFTLFSNLENEENDSDIFNYFSELILINTKERLLEDEIKEVYIQNQEILKDITKTKIKVEKFFIKNTLIDSQILGSTIILYS